MKSGICAAVCGMAFVALMGNVVGAVGLGQTRSAQNQKPAGHTQFTDGDRQVTKSWYTENQTHPPVGLRPQDRLSPDQESRLQTGKRLDPDLQKQVHTVPVTLSHRLPTPPRNNRYVAIGGHVGLVDNTTKVLRDVIDVH